MKLYKKQFCIYKDWITIIPTIDIHLNNPIYLYDNIQIEFSWLCFHGRIFLVDKDY